MTIVPDPVRPDNGDDDPFPILDLDHPAFRPPAATPSDYLHPLAELPVGRRVWLGSRVSGWGQTANWGLQRQLHHVYAAAKRHGAVVAGVKMWYGCGSDQDALAELLQTAADDHADVVMRDTSRVVRPAGWHRDRTLPLTAADFQLIANARCRVYVVADPDDTTEAHGDAVRAGDVVWDRPVHVRDALAPIARELRTVNPDRWSFKAIAEALWLVYPGRGRRRGTPRKSVVANWCRGC